MATYNSIQYATNAPIATHGEFLGINHLHATVNFAAAPTTSDAFNFGYLPPNAVVTGATLKAASQLDSNGSPTLTTNVGVAGTPQLFFAASTVGRTAGASVDIGLATAGRLYKNTSGAKQAVVGALGANPATGAAGSFELALSYFVED
jgi:hypothetical protein